MRGSTVVMSLEYVQGWIMRFQILIDSQIDMIQPHPRSIVDYSLGKKRLYTCRDLSKPCTFLPPAPKDQPGYRQNLVFGTLKKEHDRFSDEMKNFAFS